MTATSKPEIPPVVPRPWPCLRCRHLLPPDSTGTHACGRPWPELSKAQRWASNIRVGPVYIGTPAHVRGETHVDPIECATFEDAA